MTKQGPYFAYSKGLQPNKGRGLATLEEVASWALKHKDVNISLTSFEDKRGGSFREARAFWADVDVGDTYPDQETAIHAINTAIYKGLPPPIIISSGRGLHLIWTLTEGIGWDDWRELSRNVRQVLANTGLRVDAQRTTDSSNGPRVIGTVNSKNGGMVGFVRQIAPSYTPKAFAAAVHVQHVLPEASGGAGILLQAPPRVSWQREIANETPFEHDYPGLLFDAEKIAEGCLQMSALQRGEEIDEPSWQGLLAVLAKCVEGDKFAHTWSSQEVRYREEETAGRLSRIRETGQNPYTCEWFRHNGRDRRTRRCRCDGCPQTVNSPIALGKITARSPDFPKPAEELPPDSGGGQRDDVKKRHLPHGYFDKEGCIGKKVDEDADAWFKICQELHCTGWSQDDLAQHFTWEIRDGRTGEWASFSLPSQLCNSKSSEFTSKVHIYNEKAADAYIRAAKGMMMETKRAEHVRKSFGWVDNRQGFMLGDKIYRKGEVVEPVTALSRMTEPLAQFYTPAGTEADWRSSLSQILAPGQEAAAFLVLLSAGTPLHSLMTDEGGMLVVLRSFGSGHGKSTALAAAMSIWGAWRGLANWSNSTALANSMQWETAGNLPIPWDEMMVQKEKEDDLRQRVLAFSDGAARARLSRDGIRRPTGDGWSTFLMTTSNIDIRAKLGLAAGATEGPSARVFQLETFLSPDKVRADGGKLMASFANNYGWLGPRLVKAYVENPDALAAKLLANNQERMTRLRLPNAARFSARAITCAEAGGKILRSLTGLDFDVEKIIARAEETLLDQIAEDKGVAQSRDPIQDFIRCKFGELILVGAGLPQPQLHQISGRYEETPTGARLMIPQGIWAKWLSQYNKSIREVELDAIEAGQKIYVRVESLSKGTSYPKSGRTLCTCIELAHEAAVEASLEVNKVLHFERINK